MSYRRRTEPRPQEAWTKSWSSLEMPLLRSVSEIKLTHVGFRAHVKIDHHHHHVICPIIQQYAHFREYDSRRAGQQGPIRTLTDAPKTFNTKQSLDAYSITQIKILQTRKTRQINLFNAIPKNL